jgi:imidazolonepropionase-like amidohydrolase
MSLIRHFTRTAFALALALSTPGHASAADTTTAFENVTVVPMDRERMLPGHTILVHGDRITHVGPTADTRIPAGARRIDGTGKFLLPGLAEMHGHNPSAGSPAELFEDVFFLFVANGVTTVRSMLGFAGQLTWREKVARGEIVGPTLHLAGPSFSGQTVVSPQAAAERVRAQKAEGWDLLKIHPGIKLPVYEALAAAAKAERIEFSGHVPSEVGVVRAIELGQRTIDHLDGFLEHLGATDAPLDKDRLNQVVAFTRERGAWVVPTMVLWETILGATPADALAELPELRYMPRSMVEQWKRSYEARLAAANFDATRARRIAENRKVLLRALAEGGVRILFGTDAPQQFSVPGFSVHREFAAMRAAGLSPFTILQSATKNVGDYYQAQDKVGIIAEGHRADLLLINGNPLADLTHLARRSGVMIRGRWISETEIQQRLARMAGAR